MKKSSVRKISLLVFAGLVLALFLLAGCRDKVSDPERREWVWKSVYKAGELDPARFTSGPGETVLVFTGDIMPWDRMQRLIEKHGANYPYLGTAPILQNADYTVGNLECPIAVGADPEPLTFPYKVPPKVLDGLKWAGIDLVSLANNHLKDCGDKGVLETFHYLDKAGLPFFGAGRNSRKARAPYITEINGLRVAFVATISAESRFKTFDQSLRENAFIKRFKFTRRTLAARNKKPGTIVATAKKVRRAIETARRQADFVVYYPHWGIRYHRPIYEKQEELAHIAIDAGADLIIGHHAHFWQPVEMYKGKPIVYGLGNYAFGSWNTRADEGLIARVVLKGRQIQRVELIPIYTKNLSPKVWSQAKVISGKYADEMLGRVTKMSANRNALLRIEDGIGILDIGSQK
jgi:poly-gamma-glutamate synthesis protein (capsule biosynthesis protein)